jgi:sugar-specific transcriptional regulator TrmB
MNLGLSFVQAKAYLNLARLKIANIRTIAIASNVARQDMYRIMSILENLGLAEKIIAKTTRYKATPVKEGLSILLQNKKKEYADIEKQVKKIFNNSYENAESIPLEPMQFTIISEATLLLKRLDKLTDTTKNSVDIVTPAGKQDEMILQKFPHLKRAIKRGVKIRFIALEVNGETIFENPKSLLKNPLFELRYYPSYSTQFGIHIFDKREMTLTISEKSPMPCLWTNNSQVIKMATAYFENMWNEAEINKKNNS